MLTTALIVGSICTSAAAELPLVRVVLSNAGLAQFTHAGTVAAGSTVDISVRLDQVDDILKSLTIFDEERGIGALTLPGKTPLVDLFRDLPFGPEALESQTGLLNALIGAEIEISGNVSAKGRVFRVEKEEIALPNNGGTGQRHRLTVMTDKGFVQAVLEDVTALRFTDPQTNAQIARALSGLAANRAKEQRQLSIGFRGSRARNVGISYVVEAPVWKTTYRLVLPQGDGKARLQGWAVLENLTGGGWQDVELILVSGNPVALRQPLYTPLFTDRPEIDVFTAARVTPRTDGESERPRGRMGMGKPKAGARFQSAAPVAAPPPGAPPQPKAVEPDIPSIIGSVAEAAEANEGATQLLYRFPSRLTLAAGHTMMVPFVDRELPAERIWLYQPEVSERRPLAAAKLRNDHESGMPAGIVTAYSTNADGTVDYVGDAVLPLLPRGASKFVTFALDSRTDIRREAGGEVRTVIGKAVNGVLTRTTRLRRTISYEVTAPADEDREILVEERRIEGWKASAESKGVEETPVSFRHKIVAAKGKTTKATLSIEHFASETIVLTSLGPEQILARIQGLQGESAAIKGAIAKLAGIVADINRARSQLAKLDAERKQIFADQERIRRNLQSVGQGSDLGRQYIDMLKKQEDRLAEMVRSEQALEAEIAAKRVLAEQIARQLTF